MSYLSLILSLKIVVTFFTVVVPFIALPQQKIDKLLAATSSLLSIYRLYAMAIFFLLVAYASGIHQIHNNVLPIGILIMGVMSNLSVSVAFIVTGAAKHNVFHTVFFGIIGLLLLCAILYPDMAMQTAF